MSDRAKISPNARRWLDTLSFAEGTWGGSGPRYAITFGYKPIADLSRHPDQVVKSGKYASAAAGAYQFMPVTWERVQRKLGLPDFSPLSQDLGALELIRQRGVDPDRDPITPTTLARLSGEWASVPTLEGKSAYGQPVKSAEELISFSGSNKSQAPRYQAPAKEADVDVVRRIGGFLESFLKRLGDRSKLEAPPLPTAARAEEIDEPVTREELLSLLSEDKSNNAVRDQEAQRILQFISESDKAKARIADLMEAVQSTFRIDPLV